MFHEPGKYVSVLNLCEGRPAWITQMEWQLQPRGLAFQIRVR